MYRCIFKSEMFIVGRKVMIGCKHSFVKWTTPDPCIVLSESDSKLYTNF